MVLPTTTDQAITKVLLSLCSNHRINPTDTLKAIWIASLRGMEDQFVTKGLEYCMKDRRNVFMPTVGEFRGICLDAKRRYDKDARANNELLKLENTSQEEKLSPEEAKKLYNDIKKKVPLFKEKGVEKINLTDYCDLDGNTTKIIAYGHHKFEDFRDNCFNQYMIKPEKIYHTHHKETWYVEKGKTYTAVKECSSMAVNARPITVGKVW